MTIMTTVTTAELVETIRYATGATERRAKYAIREATASLGITSAVSTGYDATTKWHADDADAICLAIQDSAEEDC